MTNTIDQQDNALLERDLKSAVQVLEILDRWDARLRGHHTQKREHTRMPFRSRLTLHINDSGMQAGECQEQSGISVWSRNISQSGVCFVHKGPLQADKVIICLDPDHECSHWYNAEIVRSRQVHNDFWEFGAGFVSKLILGEEN